MLNPTKPMLKEADSAGFYRAGNGREYPRIQILTIEDLLTGRKRVEYWDMSMGELTFKKAQKEAREIAEQGCLFWPVKVEYKVSWIPRYSRGTALPIAVNLTVSLAVVDATAASRRVTSAIKTKPAWVGYKALDLTLVRAGGLGFYRRKFYSLCILVFHL